MTISTIVATWLQLYMWNKRPPAEKSPLGSVTGCREEHTAWERLRLLFGLGLPQRLKIQTPLLLRQCMTLQCDSKEAAEPACLLRHQQIWEERLGAKWRLFSPGKSSLSHRTWWYNRDYSWYSCLSRGNKFLINATQEPARADITQWLMFPGFRKFQRSRGL